MVIISGAYCTAKAVDALHAVSNFFEENNLSCNLVAVCTDGGPAMAGRRSELTALVKQKNPRIRGTQCLLNPQTLTTKILPKILNNALQIIISIMHYVKASTVNIRLFCQLCRKMD